MEVAEEAMELDDSLYSRQRYVLGDSAMQQMAKSSVFLSGLGGLGVEIAKNITLAGVKSIVVHDTQPATVIDLSSQFFLRMTDVAASKNRAMASLPRLVELNPYVSVAASEQPLDSSTDLSFLKEFQCVILTDAPLDLQLKVNEFCREQTPVIQFISCSVRGVFSYLFCDFGPEFTILDQNGEEPVEVFIGNITKNNPGVVTCLEKQRHGLETGDQVMFREVIGMAAVNGSTHTIKVVSPTQFTIGDTTGEEYLPYQHGGITKQIKTPKLTSFQSLATQLQSPNCLLVDFAKIEVPVQMHLGFIALDHFLATRQSLPRPRNEADAVELLHTARQVNEEYKLVETVDECLLRQLAYTSKGILPPLVTTLGGIAAQEALIALTGKFSPLQQWLYLDATEVVATQEDINPESYFPRGDRYDAVRLCIGDDMLKKLADLKLFMVGCGAIGCEMLKNYAMLGVGRKPNGLLTITDNDLIEKSNLNRQFLFRSHHIQKPKSVVAAQSTLDINPDLAICAQEYKVFPGTEQKIYHDKFFQAQDIVVNALDNVEARRYVDGRCVNNQRPLLESGTMGTKGHVQVIVPHQTESYSSQQDPPERDVPYCTLKSFPATIEHTIQWARDKFGSLFTQKPSMYNKFWMTHGTPENVLKQMQAQLTPDGVIKAVKTLYSRPLDWASCVQSARIKFEKYFNHKAQTLLHSFPLDTKVWDGSLFWQSPKRPPTAIDFDHANPMHTTFVVSLARLHATVCGIECHEKDLSLDVVTSIVSSTKVPGFKPSSKRIETDESAKKPEEEEITTDDFELCMKKLEAIVASGPTVPEKLKMYPITFEKDDDSNGHIDFITASSNLRASMYSIETADRFRTKLIAGRIVPAIATTTAAVAGLVSIELMKVLMGQPRQHYKNAFLNLALPSIVFSEPATPKRNVISNEHSFTLWDKWEVRGNHDFKLKDFLAAVKANYGLQPAMVVQGVRMIYVPMIPGHRKRLAYTMLSLLKPPPGQDYVDLTVSFEDKYGEDVPGPPIRYFF